MSFLQPTSTRIHSFQFRRNVYEFPVESVLELEPGDKQLSINVSAGYLLALQADPTPQPQQLLDYVKQPGGGYLAQATVTLIATGSALINGTVTLRDPRGERIVLTITIKTILLLDSSLLTFTKTDPGKEVFAIFNISQQGTETPVVLSTSDPSRFSLAVDNKTPSFSPVLTVTPSFQGTDIRIRYVADRLGPHTAYLLAETPYSTKTVLLQVVLDELSGWYRLWQWPGVRQWQGWQIRQPTTAHLRRIGIVSILLLGGLGYAGYVYRCQLIPGLCPLPNPTDTSIILPDTLSTNPRLSPADTGKQRTDNYPVKEAKVNRPANENSELEKQKSNEVPRLVAKVVPKKPVEVDKQTKVYRPTQPKRLEVSRKKPTTVGVEESDLEIELNKQDKQ